MLLHAEWLMFHGLGRPWHALVALIPPHRIPPRECVFGLGRPEPDGDRFLGRVIDGLTQIVHLSGRPRRLKGTINATRPTRTAPPPTTPSPLASRHAHVLAPGSLCAHGSKSNTGGRK